MKNEQSFSTVIVKQWEEAETGYFKNGSQAFTTQYESPSIVKLEYSKTLVLFSCTRI